MCNVDQEPAAEIDYWKTCVQKLESKNKSLRNQLSQLHQDCVCAICGCLEGGHFPKCPNHICGDCDCQEG